MQDLTACINKFLFDHQLGTTACEGFPQLLAKMLKPVGQDNAILADGFQQFQLASHIKNVVVIVFALNTWEVDGCRIALTVTVFVRGFPCCAFNALAVFGIGVYFHTIAAVSAESYTHAHHIGSFAAQLFCIVLGPNHVIVISDHTPSKWRSWPTIGDEVHDVVLFTIIGCL